MVDFKEKLLRILFPPKCISCDRILDINTPYPHICKKCESKIKISPKRICPACLRPMDLNAYAPHCLYCAGAKVRFEYLISPLVYDEVSSDIIKKYKYNSRTEIARSLALLMWERIKEYNLHTSFDVIIPAPSSKSRAFKLRTEHMLDLCKELSRLSGVPCKELLFKKEGVKDQNSLGARERKTNLKNNIVYQGGKYDKVLLVDDVYTTGATVDESCKLLKRAGCTEIYVGIVAVNIHEEIE